LQVGAVVQDGLQQAVAQLKDEEDTVIRHAEGKQGMGQSLQR
jgi:hypothetical protein